VQNDVSRSPNLSHYVLQALFIENRPYNEEMSMIYITLGLVEEGLDEKARIFDRANAARENVEEVVIPEPEVALERC
jgi:hypothetical protein